MTSDSVKSLGVVVASTLSFGQHVNNICKSARFYIKALCHIRKLPSNDASAMVAGRLDYCNAVLYSTIDKLQCLQNTGQSCKQHMPT